MQQQKRQRRSRLARTSFEERSFEEQRAALNLAQFALRQNEIDVDADGITKLIHALTAEAASGRIVNGPGSAVEAIHNALGSSLVGASERHQLLAVRRLIDLYLGASPATSVAAVLSSPVPAAPTITTAATTPAPAPSADAGLSSSARVTRRSGGL